MPVASLAFPLRLSFPQFSEKSVRRRSLPFTVSGSSGSARLLALASAGLRELSRALFLVIATACSRCVMPRSALRKNKTKKHLIHPAKCTSLFMTWFFFMLSRIRFPRTAHTTASPIIAAGFWTENARYHQNYTLSFSVSCTVTVMPSTRARQNKLRSYFSFCS